MVVVVQCKPASSIFLRSDLHGAFLCMIFFLGVVAVASAEVPGYIVVRT